MSTPLRWRNCGKKEEVIQRDLLDGIDYAGGEITVAELVDRYINLRRGLKENSMRAYGSAINRIHTDPFWKPNDTQRPPV